MSATFNVVALVCSTALNPAECQPPTAHDVMVLERGVRDEIACMREFTMSIPKVAGLIPVGYFPKLKCERVEEDRL